MCTKNPGPKLVLVVRRLELKLILCCQVFTSPAHLQADFTSLIRRELLRKVQQIKNARAKRAKLLFLLVKYANS